MKRTVLKACACLLAGCLLAGLAAGCTQAEEEDGGKLPVDEPRVIEPIAPADNGTAVLANEFIASYAEEYKMRASEAFADPTDTVKRDLYAPAELTLGWDCAQTAQSYTVTLSASQDMAEAAVFETEEETLCVDDLFVATEYFWQVTAHTASGDVTSDVFRFTTAATPRTVFIEGVSNTRDIGGYATEGGRRVKQGMVYRGAKLEDITASGREKLLTGCGIATDLDLRGSDGSEVLGSSVQYVHVSSPSYLTPNDASGSGIDVAANRAAIAQIMRVFAQEENYPVYMHCAIGRDRTGTIAMLLLTLLGVAQNDIYMEYELSLFSAAGCSDNTTALKLFSTYFDPTYCYIRDYAGGTPAENCAAFLQDCGVTAEEIASIRALLLV